MMKKLLTVSAIALSIAGFQPANAEEVTKTVTPVSGVDLSKKASHEDYKNMTDEQRKAFHEQRKAKWDSMSKEEKLQMIEKRRSEKKAKMDEMWNKMSDDEKIEFVNKKMERRGGHGGPGGHHGGPEGNGETGEHKAPPASPLDKEITN